MDSMKSLNTSLPTPYSGRPAPPEQLLQAFRTAALSVTNLYKSAVIDQNSSRATGYQDALDDLLVFLDRENLGLQDGEGWRVRQWVTARYGGRVSQQPEAEQDDERSDVNRRARTATPTAEQPPTECRAQTEEPRPSAAPDNATALTQPSPVEQEPVFKFTGNRSNQAHDSMQTDDNATSPEIVDAESSSSNSPSVPIRVEVVHRASRAPYKASTTRQNGRTSNREFTFPTGTKRKLQFPDFFDISNIGPREGNSAGSKRGRFA